MGREKERRKWKGGGGIKEEAEERGRKEERELQGKRKQDSAVCSLFLTA